MIEGWHKDTVWKAKHKSGWRLSNYLFETTYPGYSRLSIKACDEEHAWKQAREWAKEKGVEIIKML